MCRLALRRAAANLPWVDVLPQEGANVYSILQRDILVRQHVTCDSLAVLLLCSICLSVWQRLPIAGTQLTRAVLSQLQPKAMPCMGYMAQVSRVILE